MSKRSVFGVGLVALIPFVMHPALARASCGVKAGTMQAERQYAHWTQDGIIGRLELFSGKTSLLSVGVTASYARSLFDLSAFLKYWNITVNPGYEAEIDGHTDYMELAPALRFFFGRGQNQLLTPFLELSGGLASFKTSNTFRLINSDTREVAYEESVSGDVEHYLMVQFGGGIALFPRNSTHLQLLLLYKTVKGETSDEESLKYITATLGIVF